MAPKTLSWERASFLLNAPDPDLYLTADGRAPYDGMRRDSAREAEKERALKSAKDGRFVPPRRSPTTLRRGGEGAVRERAEVQARRRYESRIAQLESTVKDADTARAIAERIKQRIDSQHSEIRKLLSSTSGGNNDAFRTRLLRDLHQLQPAPD